MNAIAGTPTTANKIKIESDVATLGNGTTPLNSGNAVTDYTVTVTFSNVKAGDVITYTLPTNLDLLKYISTVNMVAGTGTTTVTKNDDGTVTITDTIAQDLVGINIQTSKVSSYNNNADITISPDQIGKTVVGYITSTYNGVADGSFAITQTYTPSITIPTSPTRRDPTPSVVSSVLPNTDYVYKFALAETPDFIAVGGDSFAQPSQQVRKMLNTGGAVITIPVPSSFVLNSSLTTDLNGLGSSTTTITQAGKGADIIITVPAGNGVSGGNLNPYYLAGSYDITQTSSNQTVTATSGATISQVAPNGMMTATTADNSVWTEQIAAADQADTETTATVSGKGNSSTAVDKLILNAGPDAPQYINQVTVNTDSAYEITDAQITFNIPDGIDGTGFTVPKSNDSYTNKNGQYTRGTTEYSYTVTHADGTVETGTVADGDTFTSSKTSPIRTIVLTPNYLAPGAGVYSFNLIGTLSDNYDDGTAVAVGDQLIFTQSVNYPSNQNANDPITATNTETVVEGVAQLRGYLQGKDSQTTPGRGAGSYLANQTGNWGQTTNYVYEPIMYFVLPSYASVDYVKVPEADLAGGVKVSYYTTDTGAKGVKIDYSGTGLYMNAGAGTGVYGVALDASPIDTVAGSYPSYYYIYSPQTTIVTGAKNAPVTDLTLTDGDANAVLVYSPNWKIETVRSTTSFNFGQGNQDSEAVTSGTSQVTGDSTINFYTNMVNSLAAETTNTSEVINLPTIGDSSGSTYTFKLNGPIELPKSFTNAANTDNPLSKDAKVLYSVSLYDDTGTATSPDTTGYMTADELTAAGYDWSDVRSIYIDVESIPVDNSTGRIKISGTTDDFPKQVGKIGYLESIYYANEANPAVGKQAASVAIIGTSDVKAQFHYVDNSGNDVYIPLPDLTKTYNDDVDTMNATDFPASEADFNATDLALIPTDYKLATNADGSLQQSIINSDVPNYSGLPNDTAAFGQTVVYYFDGDTVTYELTNGKATATVTYVDDDNNQSVVGKPSKITGLIGTKGTYTATPPTLYDLAPKQSNKIDYVIATDGSDDITVHLVHQHETGTATSTYTVKTAGLPVDKAIADDSKTENWTTDTDKVTNVVTYTPTDKSIEVTPTQVAGYSVTPASHTFTFTEDTTAPTDQEFTFEYSADPQTLTINYVDVSTGNQVATATKDGTTDEPVDYTADQVPANYVLAKGQAATGTKTLTTDPAKNVVVINVAPSVGHTTKTTTQTVKYLLQGTETPLHAETTQVVTWNISTNAVTGDVIATPQGLYAETTAPVIAGYTPTTGSVPLDKLVAGTTLPEDTSATIFYTANGQSLAITYVDDSTHTTVASDSVPGKTNESVNYTADKIPANYVLAIGQAATGSQTLSADATKNTVTIHVVPVMEHSTQDTTQTVNYVVAGTTHALHEPTTQTITWNISTNAVTGEVIATPQGAYAATGAPTIAGYTPDKTSVAATTPTASTKLPENTSATINYTADPQTLTITYVDDSTKTSVGNDSVDGVTDQDVSYTADKVPANYTLAIGQAESGTQTLSADATKNTVTIHVVPVVNHTTQDTTQTVNYVVSGTDTALTDPTTQTITWNISTNAVTGEIIATPQAGYAATTAPTIAGYTPDRKTVAADNPSPSTTMPKDSTETINYTADGQTLTINYVDDSTHTNVGTDTATGVTNGTVAYQADKVPANYVLATGQATSGTQTLSADPTKNVVTIHVVPAVAHTTQTTTQTVNYVLAGTTTTMQDPTTQQITWNISTNQVTGEMVATPQGGYAATTAPTIAGYTPDKTSVAADNPVAMTTLPEDSSATISYTADPQTLTINYVDGATGKTVATDTVPGTTDEVVNYTADKVPANYVLANGQGTTGTQTLTADPAKNVATIKVVPAVTHSTQVTTQTVNYVLAGTTTALKTPTTQQITWNISTDQVTGDIIATPQGGYAATTAPTIAGYTPDQTSVAADNPAAMTTLPADSSATISYTADPQTLTMLLVQQLVRIQPLA
ncbi:mucin-binding protein [Paucilactobacillus sp. N302-9]